MFMRRMRAAIQLDDTDTLESVDVITTQADQVWYEQCAERHQLGSPDTRPSVWLAVLVWRALVRTKRTVGGRTLEGTGPDWAMTHIADTAFLDENGEITADEADAVISPRPTATAS